jgi:serine/threonine-protein kinase
VADKDVDGTPFGRYRLVRLLGRGGMGEVWRAYDTATDRIVALKVLPANFADDQVFQERFRREAHAAAQSNEPHGAPIHDFGEIDGRLFVDMRLIEGRDLQTVLAEGPLDPARACSFRWNGWPTMTPSRSAWLPAMTWRSPIPKPSHC